ncbi:hypothetical protein SLA2020_447250 [Shorea laevis]
MTHVENSYNHRKSSEQNHILQHVVKAKIHRTYCKVEAQALAAPAWICGVRRAPAWICGVRRAPAWICCVRRAPAWICCVRRAPAWICGVRRAPASGVH